MLKTKILKIIKKESLSLTELAKRLNVNRMFLYGYISRMEEEGIVKFIWVGRSKVYQVR